MTVIRFSRAGAKKKPIFKIVVQNKTAPRDGRFIEHLGNFSPSNEAALMVNKERFRYWLGTGAQPSDSVRTHLRALFAEFRTGVSSPKTTPETAPKVPQDKAVSASAHATPKTKSRDKKKTES